jgi:hypothetical protein
MTAHAQLSPSKRHRWALCPGSIREEAKYPDERSGAAAIDGTHSHTLLEHCIKAGLADPTSMMGVRMKDDDGEFVIDADRAARVKSAIEYVKSRVAEFNGMAEVIPETRVDPQWFTHRDDLSGTVDIQIIGGGVLEIVDYKDGMGVVSAEDNPQLEQYAMGKLAECRLGWNVPEQYPWREVRMTIIQPKLALKGMNPITTWTVPVKYLLDRLSVLSAQARATDDPNAPLVPGESQCKFCRAKGSCAALAGNVMKEVGIMFQPVVTQTLDVAQQSADKDPATMDDQQIRQIMEAAPLMRQLLEAVEKEALRRLEAGTPIPGLKLVHGRGSRAWALPEEEMAEKLVKMGIPKTAIYETKLVTPAKAEKLTWEKRDGTKVSLTDRQLKRLDQEYVAKLAGKLTVVPESDSRPAVITNAAPMFSAVEAAPAAESLPSWLS